jgi:hypothetical protein
MFLCHDKKATWYLNRNLAKIISKIPFSIKLNFKPNGLGHSNKEYGIMEMDNMCVVCGTSEFLTRHHIVPFCYRQHFELAYKSRNHHDILPLCFECHKKYEVKASLLKIDISKIYDAPINGILVSKSGDNFFNKNMPFKIKGLCKLLLSEYINLLPKERLDIIKKEVSDYFGGAYTEDDLRYLIDLKSVCIKTHGEMVVEKLKSIQDFIEMWRKHFIENNECIYLPGKWKINNIIYKPEL